jgi:NitT/TauT family transport system ATP-binding protein
VLKKLVFPHVSFAEFHGFIEILNSLGGKTTASNLIIAMEVGVDRFLPPLRLAELLDFVVVENSEIELTEIGHQFAKSHRKERRKILGEQLKRIEPYVSILNILHKGKKLDKDEVLKLVTSKVELYGNVEETLQNIIQWGCFGLLFEYDGTTGELLPRRIPRHPQVVGH